MTTTTSTTNNYTQSSSSGDEDSLTTSKRYAHLQAALAKMMSASREHVDVSETIEQAWGSNAGIFQNGELRRMLESMLDRIQDDTLEHMNQFMEKENVPDSLLKLEKILLKLETEDRVQRQLDAMEKEHTQACIRAAKAPATPEQWMQYQEIQQWKAQHDALRAELEIVESDIATLEKECDTREAQQATRMEAWDAIQKGLQQTADVAAAIPEGPSHHWMKRQEEEQNDNVSSNNSHPERQLLQINDEEDSRMDQITEASSKSVTTADDE